MNIFGALLLFTIFIIAYIILVEIFTVLFRLTGLTEEKARLQVISMLTTCGFTTGESELVLSTKRRRKLTNITILFGYSFNVIIVSSIVNIFLALNQSEIRHMVTSILVMIGLLLFVWLITRLGGIKSWFDHSIERLANRMMFGKDTNMVVIIDSYGTNVMAEVVINTMPSQLEGIPLFQSRLKEDFKIQLLLIKRDGNALEMITGDTTLQVNDIVVAFGSPKNIRNLFSVASS